MYAYYRGLVFRVVRLNAHHAQLRRINSSKKFIVPRSTLTFLPNTPLTLLP